MEKVFQQDLNQEEKEGGVFILKLLFKKEPALPRKKKLSETMEKHIGKIDCFWHDEKGAGVAAKDYVCHFDEGDMPPLLMITTPSPFKDDEIDEFHASQFWDCKDSGELLSQCKYQVICTDMMAGLLPAEDRAKLVMDFTEGLLELFGNCAAVLFLNSWKLFAADDIRSCQVPKEDRFVKFAVNARFFKIEGTEDMLVDTLGMGVLHLPDLQYHFHGMDPNIVASHACSIASYILNSGNIIEDGDTIDSAMENGEFSREIMWKCRYEDALIQPKRPVIDIFMNQYASGKRSD